MATFHMTCTGTAPLLMHNSRLANPLDEIAIAMKRISGKRTKTEKDYEELARLEHAGGMYYDPEIGPYLPSDNFWRCLYDAARKSKSGPKVKEGVICTEEANPLAYKGPRTVEELWKDANFRFETSVIVSQRRVIRTRPMFREWACETTGDFDPGVINFSALREIAETAGWRVGLGDWRPKFGRFQVRMEQVG